jgi:hypothetical protein
MGIHLLWGGSAAHPLRHIGQLNIGSRGNSLDPACGLGSRMASNAALWDFVEKSQGWSRVSAPLPRRLTWTLWALIPVQTAWALWLVSIVSGHTACDGSLCGVATLNNHAAILLTCAASCVVGLSAFIPGTRGLSRCNGWELSVVAAASLIGAIALLGIVALLVGAVIVLIIVATFLFGFIAPTS